MALEYAADRIRVNEVAPGIVDAGLSASLFASDPDLRQSAMESIPTGILIKAEEVAAQVVALCEDNNPHRTGSTLLMDGGLSLR
jgi:glucose 1-dehydrogenase